MDYQTIYDRCHGDFKLADTLCQKLNIPLYEEPELTPEFCNLLGHFDFRHPVNEITRLRQFATSYEDLYELIEISFNLPLSDEFRTGIFDDLEKLATDFYRKIKFLKMASHFGFNDRYPQIKLWLISHATLDQWITVYVHFDGNSYLKLFAFEQMIRILEEEQTRSQCEPYYEELLISP